MIANIICKSFYGVVSALAGDHPLFSLDPIVVYEIPVFSAYSAMLKVLLLKVIRRVLVVFRICSV